MSVLGSHLVGFGFHGNDSINRNHQNHHSHPSQHGWPQVLHRNRCKKTTIKQIKEVFHHVHYCSFMFTGNISEVEHHLAHINPISFFTVVLLRFLCFTANRFFVIDLVRSTLLLPHHTYCTAYTQDTHIQLETVETYADCDISRAAFIPTKLCP